MKQSALYATYNPFLIKRTLTLKVKQAKYYHDKNDDQNVNEDDAKK